MEKLSVENEAIGYLDFGRLPYKVRYNFESDTDLEITNEKQPARYLITQNIGGGKTLSVYVWKHVPKEFKEILLLHEMSEAEFIFVDYLPKMDAHDKAVKIHMDYAKKHLSKNKFKEFVDWQGQFEGYKNFLVQTK